MREVFLYGMLFMFIGACSQKNTDKLTKDNYVATMLKEIKHYPKEPFYQIYVANSLCVYELLVNDFPIHKQYRYEQLATPIHINVNILKSGKQKVTIRLYPAPAEFNGRNGEFLSPDTKCDISVEVNDNAKGLPVDGNIELQEIKMPTVIAMLGEKNDIAIKEFAGKGKKYFEHSFYFDAQVPYVNKGWSEGQDLRKLDQKELEKEVVSFYKKQWNIINDKKADDLFSYLYLKEKETTQAEYEVEKELKENLNSYLEAFTIKDYKLEPLEKYKLVFYGDGKMVTLEQNSLDVRLRGKSALWAKYKDDGTTMADFPKYNLYLPQSKSLNQLEVIR